MTNTFEIATVAVDGTILELRSVQRPMLMVRSDQTVPAGMDHGAQAYVTDAVVCAVSNGDNTWTASNGKTAAAGQLWSALV